MNILNTKTNLLHCITSNKRTTNMAACMAKFEIDSKIIYSLVVFVSGIMYWFL